MSLKLVPVQYREYENGLHYYNPLTILVCQRSQVFFFPVVIAIFAYTDVQAQTHGAILKDHEDPFIQHRTATVEILNKVVVLCIGASYQFLSMTEKNRHRYRNINCKTKQHKMKRHESRLYETRRDETKQNEVKKLSSHYHNFCIRSLGFRKEG